MADTGSEVAQEVTGAAERVTARLVQQLIAQEGKAREYQVDLEEVERWERPDSRDTSNLAVHEGVSEGGDKIVPSGLGSLTVSFEEGADELARTVEQRLLSLGFDGAFVGGRGVPVVELSWVDGRRDEAVSACALVLHEMGETDGLASLGYESDPFEGREAEAQRLKGMLQDGAAARWLERTSLADERAQSFAERSYGHLDVEARRRIAPEHIPEAYFGSYTLVSELMDASKAVEAGLVRPNAERLRQDMVWMSLEERGR